MSSVGPTTNGDKTTLTKPYEGYLADIKKAFWQFMRGFGMAFAVRSTLTFLLRVLQLARAGKLKEIFSIEEVFDESKVVGRVEAVRYGLATGVFSGIYDLLFSLSKRYRGKSDGANSVFAGFFAGVGLLFLNEDDRRTVSLYGLARGAQCLYNILKARGMWHFWGSDWKHGDALLFVLSTAQIMYAYVMRPTSLPESYYKFIQRTGPIHESVLEGVRAINRNKPIDSKSLHDYVKRWNPAAALLDPATPILGCDVLHPHTQGCTKNGFRVFLDVAKKIMPVYGSLSFVSIILIGFSRFLKAPLSSVQHTIQSTLQSTLFLSTLVASYQVTICAHRHMVSKDHRFIYWIAGAISGLSILFEVKSRRSELALYALPRAVDSLYTLLYDRQWLGSLPHGELLLFSLCASGIMFSFEHEPDTMSKLLCWLINKVVPRYRKSNGESSFDEGGNMEQIPEDQQ